MGYGLLDFAGCVLVSVLGLTQRFCFVLSFDSTLCFAFWAGCI